MYPDREPLTTCADDLRDYFPWALPAASAVISATEMLTGTNTITGTMGIDSGS